MENSERENCGNTLTVTVCIEAIFELDDFGNKARRLPEFEKCEETSVKTAHRKDERQEAVYIAHFNDGTFSTPYIAKVSKKELVALELAKGKFKTHKIFKVEKLVQEEKAIYKVFFNDGECSGPFIADINENDIDALETGELKLRQHIQYSGLDAEKIKIVKIVELNEDMNFAPNVERIEKKQTAKT